MGSRRCTNKAAMQGAVKRSTLVVAALSDGFFTSDWCAAEIVAAKEAGIKVVPVYSGDDHGATLGREQEQPRDRARPARARRRPHDQGRVRQDRR